MCTVAIRPDGSLTRQTKEMTLLTESPPYKKHPLDSQSHLAGPNLLLYKIGSREVSLLPHTSQLSLKTVGCYAEALEETISLKF